MSNRTWKYARIRPEDKFTTDETAGPADQVTPEYIFQDTWGFRGYSSTLFLWVGSLLWYVVITPMFDGGRRSPGLTPSYCRRIRFVTDKLVPPVGYQLDGITWFFLNVLPCLVFYGGYIWECSKSKTLSYLTNEVEFPDLIQKVDAMRKASPSLGIHVCCSHTETRTTGSGKDRRTETHTVVTYSNTEDFPYDACEDITRFDLAGMSASDLIPPEAGIELVTVDLPRVLIMNDIMLENYDVRMGQSYEHNKHRDSQCDVHCTQTWPSHQDEFMLMLKKDFLISVPAFWLCSILGLSLPYRVFFQCKTGVMVLPIRKKVSAQDMYPCVNP